MAVQLIGREQLWRGGLPSTRAATVLTTRRVENSKLEHDTMRLTARWGRVASWLLSGAEDGVNRTKVAPLQQIQRIGSDDMATEE